MKAPTIPDLLRSHLDYHSWASRRLVEAAAQLTPEELDHDFQTADRSVLGTLVHLFDSDRVWLARLKQAPFPGLTAKADHRLAVLQTEWPALHDQWKAWAAELTGEIAVTPLAYSDMKGRPWAQPMWQLVLHVVNHGTNHRGQVSGFLRSLGRTPPPLDLTFYNRGG